MHLRSSSWGSRGRRPSPATDDGDVVARELVLAEQLADFHLDELEQLLVVDEVDLFRKTTMWGTPT
jgi:hypothetical protein